MRRLRVDREPGRHPLFQACFQLGEQPPPRYEAAGLAWQVFDTDLPNSVFDLPHHLTHKADGGKTSVQDCALFCFFHHQVVIHRWGWTVVLNPDGTTTAWNKDKTKIIHSHSPPARPG